MEAPPVILRPRKVALWQLALLGAVAMAWFILYFYDPAQNSFYPRCYLYTTTGIFCPGCGSLRAIHHLAHGEILLAMHYNLLLVAAIPFAMYYGIRMGAAWLQGGTIHRLTPSSRALICMGVALALFGILRNIPVSPFTFLAPP